jgi:hypothetical protein
VDTAPGLVVLAAVVDGELVVSIGGNDVEVEDELLQAAAPSDSTINKTAFRDIPTSAR